jgi:excisionase family DNA binding protein
VSRILGVAVSSVSKWIDEGKLVAGRTPGGHRRIEKDDFVRFLHQQKFRVPEELLAYSPKILIIDDEPSFAKWLAEELGERYPQSEVHVAFDGYSAGEIVGLVKPAVILLDLHMPNIDGFEVCRRIKSNPRIGQAAIIAITADPDPERMQRIIRMGASACFVKPVDLDALSAEIDKAFAAPAGSDQPAESRN